MLLPIALQRYTGLMQKKGFSLDDILRDADIHKEKLQTPNYYVEADQCRIVVANMMRLDGDRGIGLDAGLHAPLPNLGAVGHVLMTCKTMRDAYEPWRRFGEPLAGVLGKYKLVSEDVASMTFEFDDRNWPGPLSIFYYEELLGMACVVGHALVGTPLQATQATFAYPEPAYAYRYYDLLKCRLRFNARKTTITLARPWVDSIVRLGDEEINQVCLRHCEDRLQRLSGNASIQIRLKDIFIESHDDSLPGLHDAAMKLKMSARTLRRRLAKEGTCFQRQLNLYRADRAREYVDHGLTTKQIAARLGFDDPSAFRKSFKQWVGQTIPDYRKRLSSHSPHNH